MQHRYDMPASPGVYRAWYESCTQDKTRALERESRKLLPDGVPGEL